MDEYLKKKPRCVKGQKGEWQALEIKSNPDGM